MRRRLAIVPFALVIGGFASGWAVWLAPLTADANKQKGVRVEELGTDIEIIGRLGQPLGRLLRIEGTVLKNPGQLRGNYPGLLPSRKNLNHLTVFDVEKINGQQVQDRKWIILRFFSFLDNERPKPTIRTVLHGYEDGGMVGIPGNAMKYIHQENGGAVAAADWHFETWFQVLKAAPANTGKARQDSEAVK